MHPIVLNLALPLGLISAMLALALAIVIAVEWAIARSFLRGADIRPARVVGGVVLANLASTAVGYPLGNRFVDSGWGDAHTALAWTMAFLVTIVIEFGICRWLWRRIPARSTFTVVAWMNVASYAILVIWSRIVNR